MMSACPHRDGTGDGTPGLKVLVVLLAFVLGTTAGGCARSQYLSVRKVARNPLAGPLNLVAGKGAQPTTRTLQTLRRYDLEKLEEDNPEEALRKLREDIAQEPTADKIHAFAELAYLCAYRQDNLGHEQAALDLYMGAVAHSYDFLFDPTYDAFRNPYDPQFRRACDLYNTSLEAALRIVREKGKLLPGEQLLVDTGREQFEVPIVAHGSWRAEEYAALEFVTDYKIKGLKNLNHHYGLGVPLIAVRRSGSPDDPRERYYPQSLSFPITAFLQITPAQPGSGCVGRQCVLELYDPMQSTVITVANRRVPLESDLSTPLGYTLEEGAGSHAIELATLGLLTPDEASGLEGIYMMEPFDPDKIPVLMVHGLWSSPMTWMEMLNDLQGFPEIRENFQFWFYFYPSGEPFWYGATQLRTDLAEARRLLDPAGANPVFDDLVLVGHSMGGLVSMWQTLESDNAFWQLLSDRPFDELKANPEVRQEIAQLVFFQPNPSVRRVITIGTPHRGSRFANQYTRFLARKLIKLPTRMLAVKQGLVLKNPGLFRDTEVLTTTTSIDSLSPSSPVLPAMLQAPRPPGVHYNNIVGVLPEQTWMGRLTNWFDDPGDGVVAFTSAHRADFESELVVPADHMQVHAHPRSILEVRRCLLEQLAEARAAKWGHVAPAQYGPPPTVPPSEVNACRRD